MRKTLSSLFLAAMLLPVDTTAQDVKLERAAIVLGARAVSALEYVGGGKWYRFGQAVVPGGQGPQHDVTDLVTTIDFSVPSSQVVMTRVETGSGRERPLLRQQVDERLNGHWAWGLVPSLSPKAGNALDVQPQPGARDARIGDVWATPQGFVKAALNHDATVTDSADGLDVSFSIDGRVFKGRINANGDVESVRILLPDSVLGDTDVTYTYTGYREFPDLRFPTRIVRSQGGFMVWDYSVESARRITAHEMPVPDDVIRFQSNESRLDVLQLAEGVYELKGGNYNSVVVEQTDRVLVVEAPLDETRSIAVLAKIKSLIPGKPVKFVINTHNHFDHSGGLRTFVAEGAAVVTAAVNRPFYENAWQRPRNLQPDRLSLLTKKPVFVPLIGSFTIADARRPIVVYPVIGSGHADGLVMVYLPREKFLIEADQFAMPAEGARAPQTPNPYSVNLVANIERLKLDVRLLVPLHGRVGHMSDLRTAVGSSALQPSTRTCQQEVFYC